MKLTNYITDLGRAVAYYPGLKKVTGSTTSTILLCQFLYWSDKTTDGWIWKNNYEIEEETGLTYNEQKTAKKNLEDLNLLEGEFKRLDHTSRYRINQEALNAQWELLGGVKTKPIVKPGYTSKEQREMVFNVTSLEEPVEPVEIDPSARRSDVIKKGDLVDGMLAMAQSKGQDKSFFLLKMKKKIESRLHINADNKKWNDFIEFAYSKESKEGELLDKYIDWALKEGFNPIFWTPEKMKTLWPQAFMENDANKMRENFVEKLPDRKDEEFVSMPRDIGRKRETY